MAVIMNLAALPVKFVAIPILAGLAAGTGAVAAYVTGPTPAISASAGTQVAALPATTVAAPAAAPTTEQATSAKPDTKLSCEQQTWPYLDNRCVARGNEAGRNVRFVVAPRAGEAPAATASLVTSDTVLRGPGVAPEASDQPAVKKPAKRTETRRQRSRETERDGSRIYSVPSGESTRAVIVVRPLRLGADSPRF